MTRPFTASQKYRILVTHDALVLDRGAFVPIARYAFGTMSEVKRFAILRRIGCAVMCACGCEVWAPLAEIEFDHEKLHALGGPTVIKNGRPLRRDPCHRNKTRGEQAIVSRCDRVGRKLRVRKQVGVSPDGSQGPGLRTRRLGSRPFPSGSKPLFSRPFPQRRKAV